MNYKGDLKPKIDTSPEMSDYDVVSLYTPYGPGGMPGVSRCLYIEL